MDSLRVICDTNYNCKLAFTLNVLMKLLLKLYDCKIREDNTTYDPNIQC